MHCKSRADHKERAHFCVHLGWLWVGGCWWPKKGGWLLPSLVFTSASTQVIRCRVRALMFYIFSCTRTNTPNIYAHTHTHSHYTWTYRTNRTSNQAAVYAQIKSIFIENRKKPRVCCCVCVVVCRVCSCRRTPFGVCKCMCVVRAPPLSPNAPRPTGREDRVHPPPSHWPTDRPTEHARAKWPVDFSQRFPAKSVPQQNALSRRLPRDVSRFVVVFVVVVVAVTQNHAQFRHTHTKKQYLYIIRTLWCPFQRKARVALVSRMCALLLHPPHTLNRGVPHVRVFC